MCYTSFISVQFIITCVYMTYTRSVLYPQHPAQSLVHNRTLKYFLNEHDFGPKFPPPHNRVGGMRWAPQVGSTGARCC